MKYDNSYSECTKCRVWSKIPSGFKESKHFVKCPICKEPMCLTINCKPSDVGLRKDQEVIGTLMLHGGC